jgi:hypothetical protein
VEAQQHQQTILQFLLDPDIALAQGPSEDLPKALGLKFRYLRVQTGQSVSEMAGQMGIPDGAITALELGKHTTIPLYLNYLEVLSCSWPDFAALEVPSLCKASGNRISCISVCALSPSVRTTSRHPVWACGY